MNTKIYIMKCDDDNNAGRSPALYTCGKYGTGHAAHPYFEGPRMRVAGEAWLARTWASVNVRRYIGASYSGKGIPPLTVQELY